MKRLKLPTLTLVLVAALLFLAPPTPTWAAGASWGDPAVYVTDNGIKKIIILSFTADSSTGAVPLLYTNTARLGSGETLTEAMEGYAWYTTSTYPGPTAPDAWTITLKDNQGIAKDGGLLATRSVTVGQVVNMGTGAAGYPLFRPASATGINYVIAVTGNSTNSATGTIILELWK